MIRDLSQNHEIFLASLGHTQKELEEGAGLKEYCAEIFAEVLPEKQRWLQAVQALPTTTPSSVAYFRTARLRRRIKEVTRSISFDVVIVHCAFAAQYGLVVPARFRLMDFGDLDSGKWLDYSKWRSFPLSSGYGFEGSKLLRYEKKIAALFDYCSLTTRGELEEFNKLKVDRPHSVIPKGVDSSYFHPNGGPDPEKPVIVILGRMDYYPNIDAVLHFTRRILPIIRTAIPDVEFRIIGSSPPSAIEQLRNLPGVVVTGHVPDVRPFLRDAVLSVAPLRMARGTQNKILESMALGLPVVATSQAAKGIEATPGEHLLVADSTEDFSTQVVRLLNDKNFRERLSRSGRRRIETSHMWPASMQILDGLLATRSNQCAPGHI